MLDDVALCFSMRRATCTFCYVVTNTHERDQCKVIQCNAHDAV